MKKIAIFSDSHREKSSIDFMIEISKSVDFIFHLGDNVDDITNYKYHCPVYNVKGNNDFLEYSENLIVNIENINFLLTHGHLYTSELSMIYKAKENNIDVFCFGHTHRFLQDTIEEILFLNPGSISYPRDDSRKYIILEVNNRDIKVHKKILK